MAHHYLGPPPIDTNMVDSRHLPDVTQRPGHALATVTAGAGQVGKIYSGFGDFHCWARLLGNRCRPSYQSRVDEMHGERASSMMNHA